MHRLLVFCALLVSVSIPAHAQQPRVLVFSKTAAFRHSSIPNGIAAIRKLGLENGFVVDATEDATAFTQKNLARYAAVVFLSTTGDVLNPAQQGFQLHSRNENRSIPVMDQAIISVQFVTGGIDGD